MIERYALYEIENLRDRFRLPGGVPAGVKRNYNISPTQLAPVILVRDGAVVAERMNWGFVTQGAKDMNGVFRYKTFNAKSETVFDKVMWQKSIRHQRCLVPVNGFYEWHVADGQKHPYFIRQKDQSLFALGGIYSSWTDPDGKVHGTFSIVTMDSHSTALHAKTRRPVILSSVDEVLWLNPDVSDMNEIYGCMKQYTDDTLSIVRVGDAVNSPKATGEGLIHPLSI